MASWTNRGLYELAALDADSGLDLRCLLVTDVPAAGTIRDWNFVADVSDEVDAGTITAYARKTLTGVTITEDDTNDRLVVAFNDVAFGALESGVVIEGLVVYRHVTSDANSPVWFLAELDPPAATNGAAFTVDVPSAANGGAAYIRHG